MILDTLDGFFARLTNSSTAFGVQLDSLADMVSFGLAPAVLAFTWGLWPLKRLGWAAGFIYVTATAMRLARFNVQTGTVTDKRYFVGNAEPAGGGRDRRHGVPLSVRPAGSRDCAPGARDGARAGLPDGQHVPLPQHQGDRRRLAPVVFRAVPVRGRPRAHRHPPEAGARRPRLHVSAVGLHWAGVFPAADAGEPAGPPAVEP